MESQDAAFIAGGMTVEAALGSRTPFDAGISEIRGLSGQIEAARVFRLILDVSELGKSHQKCNRVQNTYSLRSQLQVMGACLDQLRHAAGILELEADAVSDNPLVFPDRNVILPGGNFHIEPVVMVPDNIALAVAEMAALSERRLSLLIDSHSSQLPSFLVADLGQSGGSREHDDLCGTAVVQHQRKFH